MNYRGKPVCNQSSYWTHLVVNFVAVIVLIGLAVYGVMSGSWGLAILAFLLIAPVGIYFRVIMVRRCRDIGWPTFLPWLIFTLGGLVNMSQLAGGAATALQPSSITMVPLLVGSIDFIFMIVLGCVSSKQNDPAAAFRDDDNALFEPARRMDRPETQPRGESDQESRWDAAIAAALQARNQAEQAPAPAQPRPPATGPAMARTGGFGRKIV